MRVRWWTAGAALALALVLAGCPTRRGDDDDVVDDDDSTFDPCGGQSYGGAVIDTYDYEVICVRAGEFWMGAASNDPDARPDETQHRVELTRPFVLGRTEVPQALFQGVWGTSVSDCIYGCSPLHPTQSVSWIQAVQWLNMLSDEENLDPVYTVNDDETDAEIDYSANGWRLPTEAEWEYAARAGDSQVYSGSDDWEDVAWCGGAADPPYEARPVGEKLANAWGFVDMSGNVAEWVADTYLEYPTSGTTVDPTGGPPGFRRVNRGGFFPATSPTQCRVARRADAFSTDQNWNRGFRIARTLE